MNEWWYDLFISFHHFLGLFLDQLVFTKYVYFVERKSVQLKLGLVSCFWRMDQIFINLSILCYLNLVVFWTIFHFHENAILKLCINWLIIIVWWIFFFISLFFWLLDFDYFVTMVFFFFHFFLVKEFLRVWRNFNLLQNQSKFYCQFYSQSC